MSKIGKMPIVLPQGVRIEIQDKKLKIEGPKGIMNVVLPKEIGINEEEGKLNLKIVKKSQSSNSLFGTFRSIVANCVKGVMEGWSKKLELVGSGYRVELQGRTLILSVGYSHPVKIDAPDGIDFKVEKTVITVEGINKELVGQITANIRAVRPPEPYKGKGIKYVGEYIRRKAGKAAKTVG